MRLTTAALTLTLLLAAAPAAQASTVLGDSNDANYLIVEGDDAANQFVISHDDALGRLHLRDDATSLTDTSGLCDVVDAHEVSCPDGALDGVTVNGRGGDDSITVSQSGPVAPLGLNGNDGSDVITGGPGDESIDGGPGADTVDGGGGDDQFVARGDGDTLRGGTGDDEFDEWDPGTDTLVGGDGFDVVDYSHRSGPVTVVLGDGSPTTGNGGSGDDDALDGIDGVVGTDQGDDLVGNASDNLLDGGAGDDVLDGGDGNDDLYGGTGADTLRGGPGDDYVFATENQFDPPAADASVSCGDGTDHYRGDFALEARPADCEFQLAQFTGPADLQGSAVVGSTLTASAPYIGTPAPTVDTTWWSCGSTCDLAGTGPQYTTTADDIGNDVQATITAVNDATATYPGDADVVTTQRPLLVTDAPAAQPAPQPQPRPTSHVGTHQPSTRPPSTAPAIFPAVSYASVAANALGGPASLAARARTGEISAYVRSGHRGVLRLTGRAVRAIAVFSRRGAPVTSEQVLELHPRGEGRVRHLRLSVATLAASPTAPGVVVAHLSAAQRRLVRRARSARLIVMLGGAKGVVVRFRVSTR